MVFRGLYLLLKVLFRSRYSNQAGKIKSQKNHRLCGLFGRQLKGIEVERDICLPEIEATAVTLFRKVPVWWRRKICRQFQDAVNKRLEVLVAQLCPTLCDPMDCNPPVPSVHGIPQARILEWVAIPFSSGPSQPRDQTWVSRIADRFFLLPSDPPGKPSKH